MIQLIKEIKGTRDTRLTASPHARSLVLILSMFLFSSKLFAQAYTAKHYSHNGSGSFSMASGITKDAQGYILLTTDEGIYQFDGKRYLKIKEGSYDTGLKLFNNQAYAIQNKQLIQVYNDQDISIPGLSEVTLQKSSAETVLNIKDSQSWILAIGQLIKIDSTGLSSFDIPNKNEQELFLTALNDEPLLITSLGKMFLLDQQSKSFKELPSIQSIGQLQAVSSYQNDGVIISSDSGLVNVQWKKNRTQPDMNMISRARADKHLVAGNNIFFFEESKGLMIASRFQNGFKVKKVFSFEGFHSISELQINEIKDMYYDPLFNSVWLITESEVMNLFPLIFERVNDNITTYEITSIAHLKNGLGFCVTGGNIFKTEFTSEEYLTERLEFDETVDNAFAVAGANNRLWFSTLSNYLYGYENGTIQKTIDLNFRGGIIFYLFGDSKQNLWVSQAPSDNPIIGVLKINKNGELIEYSTAEGLETRILVTNESPTGTIYCAGGGKTTYLYSLNDATQKFTNISSPLSFDAGESFEVHDLAIGVDSVVWLATTSGLVRHTSKSAEKVPIPELPKNEVIAIQITPDGILWASTDTQGIIRYDTHNDTYVVYDINAGLPSNQMYYRSLGMEPNGRVWIGSSEGVVMNVPGPPLKAQTPQITSIQINDEASDLMELSQNLTFESDLKINFQSLTYPSEGVNYSYLLDGGGLSNWIQLESQDSLHLENLDRGNYNIKLKAEHSNGFKESDVLNISFKVNEVWYKTTWALFSLLGFGAMVAIVGSRFYSRNLRFQKNVLEKEKIDLKEKLEQGMKVIEEKEKALARKEKEQHDTNWTNKSLVEFSKLLGEQKEGVQTMNSAVLSRLSKLLDVKAGVIFLKEDIYTDSALIASSTYGLLDVQDLSKATFNIGESMAGVVLEEEQSKVYSKELPDDFFNISSALGDSKPRELILVPIVFEELKMGVLELATFKSFGAHHIEFLERLAELLASKIMTFSLQQKRTTDG